jgi:hypothetical protein
MSGSIDTLTDIAGLVRVLRDLSGDIATSTSLTANISRLIDLTGAIDVFTDLSANSSIIRDLSGYIDTITSTNGFLRNSIGLSGSMDVVTYLIATLLITDPTIYKEIIEGISAINKEVLGESNITQLLNYSSDIETIADKLSIVTKVVQIMSALDIDVIEDFSTITILLGDSSSVTKTVSDDSEVSIIQSDDSLVSKQVFMESPLNNEE